MRAGDDDVQLMLAFCGGDAAAFDALFQRWAGPLLRFLERMVRDAATAEELVQEVFVRVFRARESYRPEARFSTWLYRIGTNLALNELRRPRRRNAHESTGAANPADLELIADEPGADSLVHARRVGAAVGRELSALPERQRELIENLELLEALDLLDDPIEEGRG